MFTARGEQEQRYVGDIRHEREVFKQLIEDKRIMVVPNDQEGRQGFRQEQEQAAQRQRAQGEAVATSTRKAGGQFASKPATRPKVIVDMREFRSSLPSMLHAGGMDVLPVTLLVGDYILTPEICVERKSLPDLTGSLNSGRLYTQCQSMSRHYVTPVLLIEFDEARPFYLLGGGGQLSGDVEFRNTMSKLTLLTLKFPNLRLIWSRSPSATANIFRDLKRHHAEPDAGAAADMGVGEDNAT